LRGIHRSYEREDFVFNPLHYLVLIERKINALDQAAPLADWKLPEAFATLRRLLEARMGKKGKREFVQVLRLMEVFAVDDVAAGVGDAIARGAIGFDAVKHLVLARVERRWRLEQVSLMSRLVRHGRLLALGPIPGLARLEADRSGCAAPTDDSREAADQV
jgi:hypothetical protein